MAEQDDDLSLQNCSDDDALSFESGMFKTGQVREKLWQVLTNSLATNLYHNLKEQGVYIYPGGLNHKNVTPWRWFKQGIDCEILKIGSQGWQKGRIKLKVCLEFIPNEPGESSKSEISQPIENESVLDDIRQSIA